MSESTPAPRRRLGRRGAVALAIFLAALALVGGTAIVRTTDGGPNVATGDGRAVGDAFASCLAFSLDVLARRPSPSTAPSRRSTATRSRSTSSAGSAAVRATPPSRAPQASSPVRRS